MTYNCTSILSGLPADEMTGCKTLMVFYNRWINLHLWTLSIVMNTFKIFSSMGVPTSRFREKVLCPLCKAKLGTGGHQRQAIDSTVGCKMTTTKTLYKVDK